MENWRVSVSIDQDGVIVVYARTRSGKPLTATGRDGFDDLIAELAHDENFHALIDAANELLAGIPVGHRIEIENIGGRRISIFDSSNHPVVLDVTDLDSVRETFGRILEAAQSARDPGTP